MWHKVLGKKLQKHFHDYYAGKIKRSCDEDCPEGCDGKHNYELPATFPPLFKENNAWTYELNRRQSPIPDSRGNVQGQRNTRLQQTHKALQAMYYFLVAGWRGIRILFQAVRKFSELGEISRTGWLWTWGTIVVAKRRGWINCPNTHPHLNAWCLQQSQGL